MPVHILSPFLYLRPTFKHPKNSDEKTTSNAALGDHSKRDYFKEEMVTVWTLKDTVRISNWACTYFTLYYRRLPNPLKKKKIRNWTGFTNINLVKLSLLSVNVNAIMPNSIICNVLELSFFFLFFHKPFEHTKISKYIISYFDKSRKEAITINYRHIPHATILYQGLN